MELKNKRVLVVGAGMEWDRGGALSAEPWSEGDDQ